MAVIINHQNRAITYKQMTVQKKTDQVARKISNKIDQQAGKFWDGFNQESNQENKTFSDKITNKANQKIEDFFDNVRDYINPRTKSKQTPSNQQKRPSIQKNKNIIISKATQQACDHSSAICTMINNIRHCALANQSYTKCGQKILNSKQQSGKHYQDIQQALKTVA